MLGKHYSLLKQTEMYINAWHILDNCKMINSVNCCINITYKNSHTQLYIYKKTIIVQLKICQKLE